jgi:DNA-binding NarL/FixJ family response regulator
MSVQVLVASNHSIIREGLVGILRSESSFDAEGRGLDDLPSPSDQSNVVLVDGSRPDVGSTILKLRSRYPNGKLLCLLLDEDDSTALTALRAGALGVIDRTVDSTQLIDCIKQVSNGEFVISNQLARRLARLHGVEDAAPRAAAKDVDLTQRESEVLRLLAEGCTNRDIANRLSLSEHTVRAHLRGIMQKLHVSNRVQAAALAWQGQLVRSGSREEKRQNGHLGG